MQRKNMRYRPYFLCALVVLLLIACAVKTGSAVDENETETVESENQSSATEVEEQTMDFKQISQEEAKQMMDSREDIIILDVRRADEYAEGHIPGAINVANESIGSAEIAELPDKSQTILVYCRSGRRSKEAAAKLVALGYSDICEFGGIIDWPYEIVQ